MTPSLLAISFMVALAYVTRYSGMDTVMGLSLTGTGWLFPFFGTLLGWLGVALTGTDAGSNALFGNLQVITANSLDLNPILTASTNASGGVMGKMLSPQSIAVAVAATGMAASDEGRLFRFTLRHSIVLVTVIGVISLLYAYWFPELVPQR
jgi:lactate permease